MRSSAVGGEGSRTGERWAMLSALRYRNYRFYWFGQLSSVLGQHMQFVSQSWLVLHLTGSPAMLGIAGLFTAIPTILCSLLGGAIADRVDRHKLLRVTQLCQALGYGGLATVVVLGIVQVWHVFLFAFFAGVVRGFDQPSRQALLPALVPRDEIPNAVALGSAIWNLSRLMGPALAGVLIALYDVGLTLYVACCGFLAFSVLLGFIHVEAKAGESGKGLGVSDLFEGLSFIRRNELFYTLIGMTFFNSIFGMSYTVLLPVFARDILEVGSQGYGLLQSFSGIGALAGGALVVALSKLGHRALQITVGGTCYGLLIVAFSFSPWFPLSLGIILLMGMANETYMTTINTVLQMHLPDGLRGRVMGVYGLTWSLMPLGGTISGTIAEFAGAPMAVASGGMLVAAMAAGSARFGRVRQLA